MAITGRQISATTGAIGAGAAAVNTASNLASAFSGAANVGTAIRSINLPSAGEAIGDIYSAVAAFGGDAAANDWRVRLSLPTWPSFRTSPVLEPLKDAGGLVFPYTPQITMTSSATYNTIKTVHTNYQFQAYQSSDPGEIQITAPMNVEDASQGLYWIAAMHYLRSLTKMFTGTDPKAGNPPPIVFLNGYGNYVFKNIPVVVKSFQATLDDKSDYISVPVVGSAAGAIQGAADTASALAETLGGVFGTNAITDTVSEVAGGIGQVAALGALLGIGGSSSGGISYVPAKSSFTITLMPMYSRNSARRFSLDRFVEGGYLTSGFGYI
jgi:hypothetical protein